MPQISLKSLMNDNTPTYPQAIVQPFRDELTGIGFRELLSREDVDQALEKADDKVTLVILNSVCGCSARAARPGAVLSMMNDKTPDNYVTLFAGMEKDAVNFFREKYLPGITPSSPNIALFKNGKLLHILQRYQIEGKDAMQITEELANWYDSSCGKEDTTEEKKNIENYLASAYNMVSQGE